MNRQEKSTEVEVLKGQFSKAQIMILSDYKGLSVESLSGLRKKLFEKGSQVKVLKNRLAKLALKGTEMESSVVPHLVGTTAVTLSDTDPVGPAKVFTDFAKDNEFFKFKVAVLKGKALSLAQLDSLAKLPSREVLIAQLMGSMTAPARNLVSAMAQIPRKLVNVLAAIRDQKEKA